MGWGNSGVWIVKGRLALMTSRHPVTLEKSQDHICVIANGEIIADSRRALVVHERGHSPVFYLPSEDVRREAFQQTSHQTHCPYKGDATYWTITIGDSSLENAAWSYEDPISQVAGLKGYFAFYTDKVDLQVNPVN